MTENEAIELLLAKLTCLELQHKVDYTQQCNRNCDECNWCYAKGSVSDQQKALITALKSLDEIQQYRAIGTVGKFKALNEKNVAKKPIRSATSMYGWDCPNCKDYVYNEYWDEDIKPPRRCDVCGQALDWE